MAGGASPPGTTYSSKTAAVYLFNLLVGTGVLALPSVLSEAGLLLSFIFVLLVAFLSYICITFVVEAMATTLALEAVRRLDKEGAEQCLLDNGEYPASIFTINKKAELGEMSETLFPPWLQRAFYVTIIVYLFGDLTIYATMVPSSLVTFLSGLGPEFAGNGAPWWQDAGFYLMLLAFSSLVLPLCFFDFQKTRTLQIMTMGVRQSALVLIISLSLMVASERGSRVQQVPVWDTSALPNLFGGAVYSFMCHHSLPSIVAPMADKSVLPRMAAATLSVVASAYLLLFFAAAAAFGADVQDPITFNFSGSSWGLVGRLLLLFPVFTLSTNFPMVAITLRNNIAKLTGPAVYSRADAEPLVSLTGEPPADATLTEPAAAPVSPSSDESSAVLSLCATLPAIGIAAGAHFFGVEINSLVGFTGFYAGGGVMFLIPACLALYARRHCEGEIKEFFAAHGWSMPANMHASPFRSPWWIYLVISWCALTIGGVSWYHIMTLMIST
eukprot:jgi/Mesvir1/15976/Mv08285-RA.1